jgi:hypothetical protein
MNTIQIEYLYTVLVGLPRFYSMPNTDNYPTEGKNLVLEVAV